MRSYSRVKVVETSKSKRLGNSFRELWTLCLKIIDILHECIILDLISYVEISIFFLPRYIYKGWAWWLFWSVLRSWLFIALIEAKYGFSLHYMCMHERCDLVTKYSIAVRSRYNLCHFAYTVQVLAPWKNNRVKDVCPVCWAFRGSSLHTVFIG